MNIAIGQDGIQKKPIMQPMKRAKKQGAKKPSMKPMKRKVNEAGVLKKPAGKKCPCEKPSGNEGLQNEAPPPPLPLPLADAGDQMPISLDDHEGWLRFRAEGCSKCRHKPGRCRSCRRHSYGRIDIN